MNADLGCQNLAVLPHSLKLTRSGCWSGRAVGFFSDLQSTGSFNLHIERRRPASPACTLVVTEPFFDSVVGSVDDLVFDPGPAAGMDLPGGLFHDPWSQIVWIRGVFGKGRYDRDSCLRAPRHINRSGWMGCHEWRLPDENEAATAWAHGLFAAGEPLSDIAKAAGGAVLVAADGFADSRLFSPNSTGGRLRGGGVVSAISPAPADGRFHITLVAPESAFV
jgi:hypothetical protein